MGKFGEVINQFILPLLYASNAAVFCFSFTFLALGGYLLVINEEAAVGTAGAVFAVGIVLMFCSSMGLLGLLRKSWKILGLLVLILIVLLFTLFAIMTVCFVLGYQMPSLRDIVAEGWQKGCADPGVDEVGCMQAELVANNWCWDHAGLPIPNLGGAGNMFEAGDTDPNCALDETNMATDMVVQRTHVCSISCQKSMVATLEDNMGWVAIGCYCAFFTLVLVVLWNSQTHHGLWCISPSSNEDDDENTVMAIPPAMAVIAYLLNGILGLAGLGLAIAAGAMLSSPTSFTAAFAIFLGGSYFVIAAVSCGAVAKNLHWLLRFCNIAYFVSCIPLLILSLVAAVYSGKIENVYDFYDDNWCKVRGEIDAVDPEYCKVGLTMMSDAACKNKIVSDTSDNLVIVGYVTFGSLGAVACLIWFSMRLARKFKFDARGDFDDAADGDYGEEVDDKGGDDSTDPTEAGEDDGKADPIQMGLLAAPFVISIIALGLVFGLGGGEVSVSVDCSRSFLMGKFNGTGLLGDVRFSQLRPEDGVVVDVKYVANEDMWSQAALQASVTQYEIHEFPVPADGSCDQVGAIYPTAVQGTYLPLVGAPSTTSPANSVEMLTEDPELEELYYDGITPEPIKVGGVDSNPAIQLFGETAITGRSVVLKGPGTCLQADKSLDAALADMAACEAVATNTWVLPEVACATISPGSEKVLSANFTDASGYWDGKVRGTFTFTQVITRGSESDMVIYVELEATDAWDTASTADGNGVDNGCTGTDVGDFVSCGHKAHVHRNTLDQSAIDGARSAGASQADVANGAVCGSAGAHFNLVAGADAACVSATPEADPPGPSTCSIECPACTTYACKMEKCETGDLTGMYGTVNVGVPGKPAKNVWINKYESSHSLMLISPGSSGAGVMAGRSVVIHRRTGQTVPTNTDGTAITGADRVACANIPNLALDPRDVNGR